ncbi:hypothetical protein CIK77_15860 [Microbacterium sp. JB110]|nr:hypothetical protein CIK77_15860 [Microbacterium sp. JB110]
MTKAFTSCAYRGRSVHKERELCDIDSRLRLRRHRRGRNRPRRRLRGRDRTARGGGVPRQSPRDARGVRAGRGARLSRRLRRRRPYRG